MDKLEKERMQRASIRDPGRKDWSWLPKLMPTVVDMVKERRAQDGDEWVNLCWKNGVLQGQPGWFYAFEGGISIGVPSQDFLIDPLVLQLREKYSQSTIVFIKQKPPRATEGRHAA